MGSEQTLTRLYDRHAAALLSFARSYVGDRALAEDVVQQTFLAAHRTLQSGTRFDHPRAWLFHVARNNALMVLRERGSARADADLEEALDARAAELTDQVIEREALREVVADIVALPPQQRAALTLFELGDMPQDEIAAVIGVDRRKVKALVFQARSSLVDRREARDASCTTVREKLLSLHGGALNHRLIRNHLRTCPGCTEFRDELQDRRRRAALLLPLPLLPGLREAVLGSVGAGHGGLFGSLAGRSRWALGGGATGAVVTATVAAIAFTGGGEAVREATAPEPAAAAATQAAPPQPQPAAKQAQRPERRRAARRPRRARRLPVAQARARAPRQDVAPARVQRRAPAAPAPAAPAPAAPAPAVPAPRPQRRPDPDGKPAPAAPGEPVAASPAVPAEPAPSVTPAPTPEPAPEPAPEPGDQEEGRDHPVFEEHPGNAPPKKPKDDKP